MTRRIDKTLVIEAEPAQTCELCGEKAETRPYGPKGEEICFPCGKKDRAAVERAMRQRFGLPN